MFTVIARTYDGKTWEKTYIDKDYALTVFDIAISADDCESADIIDATTGEVLVEFDSDEHVIFNNTEWFN